MAVVLQSELLSIFSGHKEIIATPGVCMNTEQVALVYNFSCL